MAQNGPQPPVNDIQQNMASRALVLARSVDMIQSINSQTIVPAATSAPAEVINIPIRNVGLIKKFTLEVTATVSRSAAETQTLTAWGVANFFKQIIFTDLSNQTRINTTGKHLFALATAKRGRAYGAAFTNDSPVDVASNFTVMEAPASFTTGDQTIRFYVEIPLAYSNADLRGAIYGNVVNATMNLQLQLNNAMFAVSTATGVDAMYKSSSTDLAVLETFSINLYQHYLDQLPMTDGGPILPLLDLATSYLLNNSVVTGLAQNQDNPIPYANFRDFLSTIIIYDDGTSGLVDGTNIDYLSIQSANYTNLIKYGPFMSSLLTRDIIMDDFPLGTYYFDHRVKPISTIQYGNMQLIVNPSAVQGATSRILVFWEAFAYQSMITQAGSLYGT